MSFQDSEIVKRKTWRGGIPVTCPTCVRFDTLREANKHAKRTSIDNTETRHVIKTGDHFFSSTTAIIFWYERLIRTFHNGQLEANHVTDEDIIYLYD